MKIEELKKWFEDECCRENTYAIGEEPNLFEGLGLQKDGDEFIWYFTERGRKQIIKTFEDEEAACEFAFNQIKNNRFAKTHLIALTDEIKMNEIINELKKRNIKYETDKIPYEKGIYKHRVFVFGCDYRKVKDLEGK